MLLLMYEVHTLHLLTLSLRPSHDMMRDQKKIIFIVWPSPALAHWPGALYTDCRKTRKTIMKYTATLVLCLLSIAI